MQIVNTMKDVLECFQFVILCIYFRCTPLQTGAADGAYTSAINQELKAN